MANLARSLLTLTLGVLVVAGCGNGRLSKVEYILELRAIEASDTAREAATVFTKMAVEDPATRVPLLKRAECAANARTLHRDLDEIVDRVDGLRPPAEVQRLQDRFVAAGRETVDIIGGLTAELEKGDLTCGQPFNQRAYGLPSTKRAEDVIQELGRRGYIFGLNSGG